MAYFAERGRVAVVRWEERRWGGDCQYDFVEEGEGRPVGIVRSVIIGDVTGGRNGEYGGLSFEFEMRLYYLI